MEEEYVTIVEAARRVGMSDKTVRRAIHDGKLEARYPQPNKAEVSITDLEAWHATLHVRPGETQDRLQTLETRMSDLEAEVQDLRRQLETSSVTKKALPKTETAPPEDHVWLSEFCALHHVPYQAAADLFPRAIHGQPIIIRGRKHIAIGPKGQHDF